jgi:probable dihydroxyacetone kinase regulator
MPRPEHTKQLLADTLKKLASNKHLDKITISEIVNEAGLNRQTFYYHFKDKQDLICWIFDTDVARLTDKNHNNTLLDDLVEYIYSEKDFYMDALTSEAQNSLRDHLYQVGYSRCVDEIMLILGSRKMDKRAIALYARIFTNAMIGCLVQWAQEGMKTNDMEFLEEYAPLIQEHLTYAINRSAE